MCIVFQTIKTKLDAQSHDIEEILKDAKDFLLKEEAELSNNSEVNAGRNIYDYIKCFLNLVTIDL